MAFGLTHKFKPKPAPGNLFLSPPVQFLLLLVKWNLLLKMSCICSNFVSSWASEVFGDTGEFLWDCHSQFDGPRNKLGELNCLIVWYLPFCGLLLDITILVPSPSGPSKHGDWRPRLSAEEDKGYAQRKAFSSPILECHLVLTPSGREQCPGDFGLNWLRSKCFQVQPVVCWYLLVCHYFKIYSIDSSKLISDSPKVSNLNWLFLKLNQLICN